MSLSYVVRNEASMALIVMWTFLNAWWTKILSIYITSTYHRLQFIMLSTCIDVIDILLVMSILFINSSINLNCSTDTSNLLTTCDDRQSLRGLLEVDESMSLIVIAPCLFILAILHWTSSLHAFRVSALKPFVRPRPMRSYHSGSSRIMSAGDSATGMMSENHYDSLSEDYIARFKNIARLYADSNEDMALVLNRLYRSNVCIIGLGGVGSWVVESIARSGVNSITLIDVDDVCISNINRQLVAVSSTVGQFKAEALKQRILDINPNANVTVLLDFVRPFNVHDLLTNGVVSTTTGTSADGESPIANKNVASHRRKFDYVVDAADSVSDKAAIVDACVHSGTPIITTGEHAIHIQANYYYFFVYQQS